MYAGMMSVSVENTEPRPAGATECCVLDAGPLEAAEAEQIARQFKVLADPMRLTVMSHVATQGCDAVCACDLIDILDIG